MTIRVYIGIGSNLDDPVAQVKDAIEELGKWLCDYVKTHKERLGSKEWLRLFRILLPQLLEEGGFQPPTDIDIQRILEGGPVA